MDLTCKARWAKDGHKTPIIKATRYAGVVSCESIHIALTFSALNDVDVLTADTRNAYLQRQAWDSLQKFKNIPAEMA
ncbi:hypothetical protein ACHAXR_006174 [Thalassiosira sp. AJA248-18]